MIRHTVLSYNTRQSQHDITTVMLLLQLSDGSWMSPGHHGGLTFTFAVTTKEGLIFPLYGFVCMLG
jgi:hypothetical protein